MYLAVNLNAEMRNNLGQLFDVESQKLYSKNDIILEVLNIQDRLQNEFEIKTGDRVVLKNGNNSQFFFQLFAIWSLGAVAIPTSDKVLNAELTYIIKETDPCLIIEKNGFTKISRQNKLNIEVIENEALILFTSGTTAQPKGVIFDLPSILGKIKALAHNISINDFSKTLCVLSTNFGHGLFGNCLFPLLNGGELYIMPTLDLIAARNLSKVIDSYKITFFSTVPSFWPLLFNSDKIEQSSTLQRVHCASARLNPLWVNNIKNWIGSARLFNVYGTTETLSWIGAKEIKDNFSKSEISDFWGVQYSLEENEILPERKEISIRSKFLFSHYLNNPIQTKNAKPENGKFLTGDLGYLNTQHELVICGRKDSIINKGGFKISPDEIDAQLVKIPAIQDACTFSYSDPFWGDKVGVAVVLKIDTAHVEITEKDIFDIIAKELSANKLPDKLWIVQNIPRNHRGKINREDLKKLVFGEL